MSKLLFVFLISAVIRTGLRAQPVESEMDRPLDMSGRWSFYHDETVYLQHQCSVQRARMIATSVRKFFDRVEKHLERSALVLPLQLRIYSGAEQYRRALRFSRHREAHYNPRLEIITAHCGISSAVLAEQLALFWLADAGLRTWQRYLLAEALPRMQQIDRFRPATAKPSKKRVQLSQVILSDHVLDPEEQRTLAGFVEKLAAIGQLRNFLLGLYRNRGSDDTGLDLLEAMLPGISGDILSNRELDFSRYESP